MATNYTASDQFTRRAAINALEATAIRREKPGIYRIDNSNWGLIVIPSAPVLNADSLACMFGGYVINKMYVKQYKMTRVILSYISPYMRYRAVQ